MDKINLIQKANEIRELYDYNKILEFNDHMMTLVKVENRTLDFHIHPDSDEIFWVIEGKMQVEFENGLKDLSIGEMIKVPKGTKHRPVCKTSCTCLLIEKKDTLTPDNTGGTYKS